MPYSLYNIHRHHKRLKHKKSHSVFDHFMFFIAILGPIMTIPQVYDIWSTKKVAGFSSLTWGSYTFLTIFWIIYALVHKEKPVLLQSAAFFILNGLVLIGILLFQN